ncbi:MAG TPA: hypothetical protein VIJ75_10500 [Hanamia sp.]
MCNCGSKRAGYVQLAKNNLPQKATRYVPPKMWEDVSFRYQGKTSLTAVGSITGKHYRFQKTGDILIIDYRDANGIMAIPNLEKIISMAR